MVLALSTPHLEAVTPARGLKHPLQKRRQASEEGEKLPRTDRPATLSGKAALIGNGLDFTDTLALSAHRSSPPTNPLGLSPCNLVPLSMLIVRLRMTNA